MKENKYDDPAFFDAYSRMERSQKGLEGAGEWHVLRSMMPELAGKRVLDLGCGYGWHCRYAAENGAAYVLGTDISKNMIAVAEEINCLPQIEYRVSSAEDLSLRAASFDVVISSLALHYVESFCEVAIKVSEWLAVGGSFLFSVEHPIFTAHGAQQWHSDENGNKLHWPVDNYFAEGRREADFLDNKVIKYHRTLTAYLNSLLSAGFDIRQIIEPLPSPQMLAEIPGMKDELRRPMMLLVSAFKR